MEKDYFGLQYTDKNGDHLWVNLRNPLAEQLPPNSIKPALEMRVKYFVQPQKLIQPITRLEKKAIHNLMYTKCLVNGCPLFSPLIDILSHKLKCLVYLYTTN